MIVEDLPGVSAATGGSTAGPVAKAVLDKGARGVGLSVPMTRSEGRGLYAGGAMAEQEPRVLGDRYEIHQRLAAADGPGVPGP